MLSETPYDILTFNMEQSIISLFNNSGLTITTISLIIDKIKVSIDVQKKETITQLQESMGKQELQEQKTL